MNKRKLKEKELKKKEEKALYLIGTEKYHQIQKNHERIMWLRKYLKIPNKPKRISLAEILLQRMI